MHHSRRSNGRLSNSELFSTADGTCRRISDGLVLARKDWTYHRPLLAPSPGDRAWQDLVRASRVAL